MNNPLDVIGLLLMTRKSRHMLAVLVEDLERHREEAKKISLNCRKQCTMGKNMDLIRREAEDYPPYKDLIYLHELQIKECPKICPKYKSPKYSTFQKHCNKCGHETEHELIQDDSGEEVVTQTSCLICGDYNIDVDPKMKWGEGDIPKKDEPSPEAK